MKISEQDVECLKLFDASMANDLVSLRIFVRNSLIIPKVAAARNDPRGDTDPVRRRPMLL